MREVRIKLDANIVAKVATLKSAEQSVAGYIHHLIGREYDEWKQQQAALAYMQFLKEKPEEQIAMETWESGR